MTTTSIRGLGAIILAATLLAACTKREEEKAAPVEEKPAVFVPPAEPARAAFTPKADASYTLVARKANKCLQFTGANEDDGACRDLVVQRHRGAVLHLQPVPGGYFPSSTCAARSASTSPASRQTTARARSSTPATAGKTSSGSSRTAARAVLRLVARHSGKVLDVANEDVADGTPVNQWSWKGMSHQEFTLVPLAAPRTQRQGR